MKILRRLAQELKNLTYEITSSFQIPKGRTHFDVPYVCQFSIPENAEPTLKKTLVPVEDPEWAASGATSPKRYSDWAFTMCGMASTAMILDYFLNSKLLPAVLAEDALLHQVYTNESASISDMRYRQYVTWVSNQGLRATFYTRLSVRGLEHALTNGKLAIVSVNPNIRGFDTAPLTQKGGHLVVVTGYDLNDKTITINNPSGFSSSNTQHHHKLPLEVFEKYYAGRGIILSARQE